MRNGREELKLIDYLNYLNSGGADRKPMRPLGRTYRKGREERKAQQQSFVKKHRTDTNLYELSGAVLSNTAHG
ncbi:hypothetical protein ig2599ANME_0907 [groundwater metagenome]